MTASTIKQSRRRTKTYRREDSTFGRNKRDSDGFGAMIAKEKLIGLCENCNKLGNLASCECVDQDSADDAVGHLAFVQLSEWLGYWKSVMIALFLWGGGVVAALCFLMKDWFS